MRQMTKWILAVVLSALLLPAVAHASELDDARAAGHVVELATGYIKATPKAPARVTTLVRQVNERRLMAYKKIAQKNRISVEQVGRESYALRHPGKKS